jgi:hypothetical protein
LIYVVLKAIFSVMAILRSTMTILRLTMAIFSAMNRPMIQHYMARLAMSENPIHASVILPSF